MGQFGIWMIILGVGSFVLNLMNMEFKLLMWVDLWGPAVGTCIRLGAIALGVMLLVLGRATQPEAVASEDESKSE